MKRAKVLVFMVANLGDQHGGNLWVINLMDSLSRVGEMEFVIVTGGAVEARGPNEQCVRSFGFSHIFVPLRNTPDRAGRSTSRGLIGALLDKYYFLAEKDRVRMQRHVDALVMGIVRETRPDLIVVNDIWSAMCFPSAFSLKLPACLITLNDEAAFHRLYRSHSGTAGHGLGQRTERWISRNFNWIANWRMERYAHWAFKRCAGIVALTSGDLPVGMNDCTVQAVIPPLLTERAVRWSYRGRRCVFFVGNTSHFPNRLAVDWICQQLAPELCRLDGQIRITIIGGGSDQRRIGQGPPNVTFLGQASKEDVIDHMTADDIFIAPIANGFGAKLKLAECASYGTPFLATQSALSGLPFLTCVPKFDLCKPADAAELIVEYVSSPTALLNLSRVILEQMRLARAEQGAAWGNFLRRSMSRSALGGASDVLRRQFIGPGH